MIGKIPTTRRIIMHRIKEFIKEWKFAIELFVVIGLSLIAVGRIDAILAKHEKSIDKMEAKETERTVQDGSLAQTLLFFEARMVRVEEEADRNCDEHNWKPIKPKYNLLFPKNYEQKP
jgi:hypothetical protein